MAKTQMSLSDDGKVMGRPTGFRITVRELRPSLGAGFIVALTGKSINNARTSKTSKCIRHGCG